jgi:hypothetical protein
MFSGRIRLLVILISFYSFTCEQKSNRNEQADKAFLSLKENQARIIISIDGKPFYADKSIFTGQVLLSDQMMSMTLTDQFEGRTIITIGGETWYLQKPVSKKIILDNPFNASVKMGKIIDKEKMIGEGYMMAEGEISAQEFSREKMVFAIKGKVGKYSDFQQPEKYVPVEGFIVYKKPAINMQGVLEKEVFSSMNTR